MSRPTRYLTDRLTLQTDARRKKGKKKGERTQYPPVSRVSFEPKLPAHSQDNYSLSEGGEAKRKRDRETADRGHFLKHQKPISSRRAPKEQKKKRGEGAWPGVLVDYPDAITI